MLASRKALGKLCVRACFTADTPVHTRFGPRPIAEVQVGDEVWAWEEHSQQAGWKTVLEVYRSQTAELAELHFGEVLLRLTPAHWLYAETAGWTAAGDLQPGQRVRTCTGKLLPLLSKRIHTPQATAEHPFWANGGWKVAGELVAGGTLLRSDGLTIPVRNVTHHTEQSATVYNVEVVDYHTYLVSWWMFIVHNANKVLITGTAKEVAKSVKNKRKALLAASTK